jgi:hypothetical protein
MELVETFIIVLTRNPPLIHIMDKNYPAHNLTLNFISKQQETFSPCTSCGHTAK